MNKAGERARVLLIDDDEMFRRVMTAELTRRGYSVAAVASGREALEQTRQTDVVLLDLRLPDMDGLEVLERLRERSPSSVGVVVLTGHGTIDTAIRATRLGAYDYLEKPCQIERLEMAIQKTYEHVRLVSRQRVLEDGYAPPPNVASGLVGTSPAFVKLLENVTRIAKTGATTLVLGETGAGKEMVAKLIHAQSPRAEAPFVVVDCAALHEELLQSEIFGHEKGAFTGAVRLKHGLFEVAHSGTIFLDEVGDTSPDVQAKLLRVLETNRFRRLGGTEEIAVDVRIVAATNRNLKEAIARGHFREDLFYRLSTFTVEIPPLRERRDDIRVLAEHFTSQLNARFSVSRRLSEAAVEALTRHSWPGNVRELIHVLEQAVALSDGEIVGLADLPVSVLVNRDAPAIGPAGAVATLREVERSHMFSVLDRVEGNRAQAARLLGVSERSFYRLLRKYRRT